MKKLISASLLFTALSSFAGTGEVLCSTANLDHQSAINELNVLQLSIRKITAISQVTFVQNSVGIKACVSVVKE